MSISIEYPKISVIMGNHSKRYYTLEKYSVRSVLESDYPKELIEVVIVDNNCDKDSFRIIKKMFSGVENVKVIKENKPNCSIVRNKGFENSTGEIIAFIDDDCEVDEGWLKRIANFYSDKSINFGGGAIFDVKYDKFLRKCRDDPNWPEDRRIAFGNMSCRRRVLEKNKIDENMVYGKEEFEFVHRLLKQGMKYYFDEMPVKHHRAESKLRDKSGVLLEKGKKEEDFGEMYFKTKSEVFDRNYGRDLRLLNYIIDGIKNLNWNKEHIGSLRWLLIPLKVRIQVYKDLKRLEKFGN